MMKALLTLPHSDKDKRGNKQECKFTLYCNAPYLI